MDQIQLAILSKTVFFGFDKSSLKLVVGFGTY